MSILHDLNDYKLETQFEKDPDSIVHTFYKSNRARGLRKVVVKERWYPEEVELGAGTFGTVRLEKRFLDRQQKNVARRAVKHLNKLQLERKNIDYKKELIALTKFSRSKFSQHEIFVKFFGWFEDPTTVFLAMEYFPDSTLDKYLYPAFQEADTRVVALQLLEGLNIMHEEAFTHRDLKPQNIFVVQKSPWWVKIGDFGITKRVSNNDTALHTATGTPHYLAPEVFHYVETEEDEESSSYTNAVDIWSFACVVYQMMALQVPFPNYPINLITFCKGGAFPEAPLAPRTSTGGIEFIKKILVAFPNLRPGAKDLLEEQWLHAERDDPVELSKHSSEAIITPDSSSDDFEHIMPASDNDPPDKTIQNSQTIRALQPLNSSSKTKLQSMPRSTKELTNFVAEEPSASVSQKETQVSLRNDSVDSVKTGSSKSQKKTNKPEPCKIRREQMLKSKGLPDAVQTGQENSTKSARSIRTTRSEATATVQDLMRELAELETKYIRELKVLVEMVIPVLLTCVFSKSDSAIASHLFNPKNDDSTDVSITKPIVDLGLALERLKSLHKRIPLVDPDLFITWANTAHKTYQDYLKVWRAGFQDVVVNLGPASRPASAEELDLYNIPRNKNGDVLSADGQRADVNYFLKRPLARVKSLAKTIKGISNIMPSERSNQTNEKYQDLIGRVRRRCKEEFARLEDQRANNTDVTRVRDLKTLGSVEAVKIDRTRQVQARDIFTLDLEHSGGERISRRVELILRDKLDDVGDVLVCEIDDVRRLFLLFPPISRNLISARLGNRPGQLVIMIRGAQEAEEWSELLVLHAKEEEAAAEWVEMVGTTPVPYWKEKEVALNRWVLNHSYFTSGQ